MLKQSHIRIMIADDHRIFREGLRTLIDKEPDLKVVAETDNGREAVQMARQQSVDIIVMDIAMPFLNGIDATRQILSQKTTAKIIVLSMYSYRRFLMEAFAAGASGYLLKDGTFDEMVEAIRTVTIGRKYVSPRVADIVIKECLCNAGPVTSALPALSCREREVLQLIAEGRSTKQIAVHLSVSSKTIEVHRSNIMHKLDINNIPELTKYAIREGIISLDK